MVINVLKNDSFQIDIVAHVNVSGELSFLEETVRGIGITTRNIDIRSIILVIMLLRQIYSTFSIKLINSKSLLVKFKTFTIELVWESLTFGISYTRL